MTGKHSSQTGLKPDGRSRLAPWDQLFRTTKSTWVSGVLAALIPVAFLVAGAAGADMGFSTEYAESSALEQAMPPPQAIVPPPVSQRVNYLGQTGGLIKDFIIEDELIFAPEGSALTILRMSEDGSATVLSRVSPNQGQIRGIALSNEVVYLITPIGLAVIDVHDPLAPQVLSFLPGGGEAVEVSGEFVFVAARAAGLRAINISDASQPVLANTFPLPGKALAVALDGKTKLAYVAADEGGLRVVDVGAPDVPQEVASLEPPAGVQELEFANGVLFLSSGDRILVVDASRPGSLVRLGEYAPPRSAHRAKISENHIFIADLDGGLKIFDVSNMARPLLIYAETEGTALDVLVRGNRAYVADGRDGIRILDVGNPASPRLVAQFPIEGVAQGLDIRDDLLLVAAGEAGLSLVHIANERAPSLIAQLDTAGDARDVKAGESVAYVADGPEGLAIISLVQRASPELRGTLYTAGEAQALDVGGTFVYIAVDDGGLQIVDTIRPAAPYLVGDLTVPDGQRVVDIALINKRAYLAIQGESQEDTGLAIADVGFRNRPIILSRVIGPGDGVAVRGVEPVIVGGTSMMTIDARASSGPVLLGHYQPPLGAGGMDWANGTLFLTSEGTGPELTLLDVDDLTHPREILHVGLTSEGGRVITLDGTVYLAAGRRGLRWFSVADRLDPQEQAVYDPMDTLIRLISLPDEPGRVYGAGEEGWAITDIQTPTLPEPLHRVQTDAPVHSLARDGDRLYAVSTDRGLLIYRDPLSEAGMNEPDLLGQWPEKTMLRDLLVQDGYLYLADRQAGLLVVDPNPLEHPTLIQTLSLPAGVEQIVPLDDGLAYLRSGGETPGLRLLDLGHPTVGVLPIEQFPADVVSMQIHCPPSGVECPDPYLYTLDGATLAVWTVETGLLERLTSFKINGTVLLLAGDRAYVGSDAGHVSIVDLREPSDARVLGMMGNGAPVRGMVATGNLLFTGLESRASGEDGRAGHPVGQLRVWNVEEPQNPRNLGQIETPSPFALLTQQLQTGGKQRIVTAGETLSFFEWHTNSASPDASPAVTVTLTADLMLPVPATSLQLSGDLAYVGTGSGLAVIEGISGDEPVLLADLPLGEAVRSVAVLGDRGYLAAGESGLVLDLSDPSDPRPIANLPSPTGSAPRQLIPAGEQMWAVWDGWLGRLDLSRPLPGPSELATITLPDITPTDLAVQGNLAYVTDLFAGLFALDISDPTQPILLGSIDTPGQAHAFALAEEGRLGYVADGECGVRVVALDGLSEIGFWQTGYALDVAASGSAVYVADIGELMVLDFDPTGEPSRPAIPQSPVPADDAMFYRSETALSWGPPATQCDPLHYDLYLGDEDPPPLVASGLLSPTFYVDNLERWQTYYWRVVVHDRQGDETAGPLWQFHVRTAAQPPPIATPVTRPDMVVPDQDGLPWLIGGLLLVGTTLSVIWWLRERLQR
jgi:hypothetical protein